MCRKVYLHELSTHTKFVSKHGPDYTQSNEYQLYKQSWAAKSAEFAELQLKPTPVITKESLITELREDYELNTKMLLSEIADQSTADTVQNTSEEIIHQISEIISHTEDYQNISKMSIKYDCGNRIDKQIISSLRGQKMPNLQGITVNLPII